MMGHQMKTYISFLAVFVTLTMFSCQDQGASVEPQVSPKLVQHGYYVSGEVAVNFADTVTLAEAESFVRSLNLNPMNLTSFENDPPHWGTIGVPIGMEQSWADSLMTYSSFVKNASRIALLEVM
jgi:hypothetical protein